MATHKTGLTALKHWQEKYPDMKWTEVSVDFKIQEALRGMQSQDAIVQASGLGWHDAAKYYRQWQAIAISWASR